MSKITIGDAVAVLNERRHNGYSEWKESGYWYPEGFEYARSDVIGLDECDAFSGFEAIAIAEKYLRDAAETEGGA